MRLKVLQTMIMGELVVSYHLPSKRGFIIYLLCMYVCMYVCIDVCKNVCMYGVFLFVCKFVRMYVCIYVYVCMYVCMYVCLYVYYNNLHQPSGDVDPVNVATYTVEMPSGLCHYY